VIDGLTGDQRFFLAWAQRYGVRSKRLCEMPASKAAHRSAQPERIPGEQRRACMDTWYKAFNDRAMQ
jgi:predicted metalloendopeptidase